MSKTARAAAVLAAAATFGASAGPALADTGNFGQQVRMCAQTMLPNDLSQGGSIAMPDGSMSFPTFGAMVRYMHQNPMCS